MGRILKSGLFFIALLWVGVLAGQGHTLTGEEILRRVDANLNYDTIMYTGKMEIYLNATAEPKVKIMKMYGNGVEKAFIEFLNAEDKNTRYLKIGKKMWIYDAEEENVFLISGHMLKQGIMGSDVSYEEALEADELFEKYEIEITGEEVFADRPCTIVTLTAKDAQATYYQRKMWVDNERFVALKEEKYGKSGKLLKENLILEIEKVGDRFFPVKMEVRDKLRKGSKTILTMAEIQINEPLDEKMFTLQYLQR